VTEEENNAKFAVPAVTPFKKAASDVAKPPPKVVSNGVKNSVDDNELIICDNSSSNSVGFGGVESEAGFDPLSLEVSPSYKFFFSSPTLPATERHNVVWSHVLAESQ
jgi:hypothetical protein